MEVVVTVLAAVVVLVLAGLVIKMLLPRKEEKSVPSQTVSEPEGPPAPVPTPIDVHDALSAAMVGRRIRTLLQANPDVAASLATTVRELDQTEEIADIIIVLDHLKYPPSQIAPALMASGYTLAQTVALLNDYIADQATEWWEVIYPLTTGQTRDRCAEVMALVGETEEHDWMEDQGTDSYAAEFVPLFVAAGCDPTDVVDYFYDRTGLQDFDILEIWPATCRPTAVEFGALLAANDIELEAEDVQAYYEQEIYTFEETLKLFKAAKVPAQVVVEGLADSMYDDGDAALMSALITAGYNPLEAMDAVNDDHSHGEVIKAGLEEAMSLETMVTYLVSHHVDPDALDEEMRDCDIDIEDRVRILHAYLFQPSATAEPEGVGETNPPISTEGAP